MSITGNLKTFYLSSLLQLLSNDKKTGILELTDGNDIVQIFLREGTIINAFGSSRVERLTNYLRSEGIITEEQLDKSLNISAYTGKKIGKVLVEQDHITEDLLKQLLHNQVEQTLFSLFMWEQGEFEYRDQDFDLSGQIVTSFDTMGIVLEASRRADEISDIRKHIPAENEVLAVTPQQNAAAMTRLNTAERAMLSLINGRRTLRRVVIDSGYDDLQAYKILFSLVSSGLIIRQEKILRRADDIKDELAEREHDPAARLSTAAPVLSPEADSTGAAVNTTAEKPRTADKREAHSPDPAPVATAERSAVNESSIEASAAAPLPADDRAVPPQEELDFNLEADLRDDVQPGGEQLADAADQQKQVPESALSNKTIIKINGRIISEIGLSEIQSSDREQFEPVGKEDVEQALRHYREVSDEEDDLEFAQAVHKRRRRLIAGCAGLVIAAGAALLLLKPVFSPELPEPAPVPPRAVPAAQPPAPQPEPAEAPAPEAKKPPEPDKPDPAHDPGPPVAVSDFFQDQNGWFSINLPTGYRVNEQADPDRVRVLISYGTDITVTFTVTRETETWDLEEEMYAAIVRIQEHGAQKIERYGLLSAAGCPGYVLHISSERDQKPIRTALYRFMCFNKNASLQVNSSNWRAVAVHEQSQKIYSAIEASFLIYP